MFVVRATEATWSRRGRLLQPRGPDENMEATAERTHFLQKLNIPEAIRVVGFASVPSEKSANQPDRDGRSLAWRGPNFGFGVSSSG